MIAASHASGQTSSQIIWASILASAGIALLTTLLIEYLAKPWLEARKDRILEQHQMQRQVLRDLAHVLFVAGRMLAAHDEQDIPINQEFLPQGAKEIQPLLMVVVENIDVPSSMEADWTKAATHSSAFAAFLERGNPSDDLWTKFDADTDKLEEFFGLLRTPRWRLWKRRRMIKHLKDHARTDPTSSGEARSSGVGASHQTS